jgi:hypothetical protein
MRTANKSNRSRKLSTHIVSPRIRRSYISTHPQALKDSRFNRLGLSLKILGTKVREWIWLIRGPLIIVFQLQYQNGVKPDGLLGKRLKLKIETSAENLHCYKMVTTGMFQVFCAASTVAYADLDIIKTGLRYQYRNLWTIICQFLIVSVFRILCAWWSTIGFQNVGNSLSGDIFKKIC